MIDAYDNLAKTLGALYRQHPVFKLWGTGPIRLMGIVGNYACVRRPPDCAPFMMRRADFDELPACDKEGNVE
jgi:hypothetical protein